MTTIELKIVHTTDPQLVADRQTARAHKLLTDFLEACDAERGDKFWAFYRLLDPGLEGLPALAKEGNPHDRP